jgi:hypothetical protein
MKETLAGENGEVWVYFGITTSSKFQYKKLPLTSRDTYISMQVWLTKQDPTYLNGWTEDGVLAVIGEKVTLLLSFGCDASPPSLALGLQNPSAWQGAQPKHLFDAKVTTSLCFSVIGG